jgi:sec-independent protein translocase protein TatA
MVGDILQPTHLLFILVVALLVLGPKRLPEVGRTLGSGLRDFRQAINGESTSHDEPEPHAYVETEPDTDIGPAFGDHESAVDATDDDVVDDGVAHEPTWTPEPEVDTGPAFAADSAAVETDAAASATASDDDVSTSAVDADEPVPERTATASSSGFASALAASRQQSSGDDEPADE